MTNRWGTASITEPEPEPPSRGLAELVCLAIATACLSVAVVACAFQYKAGVEVARGLYAILAAGIVIGGDGWMIAWSVSRAEAQMRRCVAGEMKALRHEVAGLRQDLQSRDELLAELTSKLETVSGHLDDLLSGRPRLASQCRVPGTYMSRVNQGDAVGIRAGTVDAPTDPSGSALQRAREDGIEEGFDIGLKVQLAERGVTPIPRPRRPRLTGDS